MPAPPVTPPPPVTTPPPPVVCAAATGHRAAACAARPGGAARAGRCSPAAAAAAIAAVVGLAGGATDGERRRDGEDRERSSSVKAASRKACPLPDPLPPTGDRDLGLKISHVMRVSMPEALPSPRRCRRAREFATLRTMQRLLPSAILAFTLSLGSGCAAPAPVPPPAAPAPAGSRAGLTRRLFVRGRAAPRARPRAHARWRERRSLLVMGRRPAHLPGAARGRCVRPDLPHGGGAERARTAVAADAGLPRTAIRN